MTCPTCLKGKLRTLEAREGDGIDFSPIARFAQDWPDLVARRRKCLVCQAVIRTVEVPFADMLAIQAGA